MTWRKEKKQYGPIIEDVWVLSRDGQDVGRVTFWDDFYCAFAKVKEWKRVAPKYFPSVGEAMREIERQLDE